MEAKHDFYIVRIDNEFYLTYKELDTASNDDYLPEEISSDEVIDFEIGELYCDINNDGEVVYATKPGLKMSPNISIFDVHGTLAEAEATLDKLNDGVHVKGEDIVVLFKGARK